MCESYHHAVTLAALGVADFVGLWDKFSCFYVARKNLFSLVLFIFPYIGVYVVSHSPTAPQKISVTLAALGVAGVVHWSHSCPSRPTLTAVIRHIAVFLALRLVISYKRTPSGRR